MKQPRCRSPAEADLPPHPQLPSRGSRHRAAGTGNPGNSRSNQRPKQPDYSPPRVLRKQQYGVCPRSEHPLPATAWQTGTLGTMPERSHVGSRNGPRCSGMPGMGVWERLELGTAEHIQPTDRQALCSTGHAESSNERLVPPNHCLHQSSASNGAGPCTAGVSTKRWGSIAQCLICSKKI